MPDQGVFKVILHENVPPYGNIYTGHVHLPIKLTEDGNIKYNARYVFGGH